uniref:Uncharacterized protein n=1 Tax=Tetraodon nigroviridis TaxID=99883 RepID=H3CEJ8_TETNG
AQHSNQSPVSLASEASSPRPYVSPRSGTPQSSQKALHPASAQTRPSFSRSARPQVGVASAKARSASGPQAAEKHPEDPRTLQQRRADAAEPPKPPLSTSQDIPCSGSNTPGAGLPLVPPSSSGHTQADAPSSFTPTLAAHFDETLVRHLQGWPSETTEKQAARTNEDFHNMGSLYMSEICTEMKNLRSLVRVCEIQATLREQRILVSRWGRRDLGQSSNSGKMRK